MHFGQYFGGMLRKAAGHLDPIIEIEADGTITFKCQCFNCKKNLQIKGIDKKQWEKWQNGMLMQNAMPTLTPSQREIIISQTCDDCFYELFKEEEEDDEHFA